MQNTLTFKTSYFEDSFRICKGPHLLLKIYKSTWLGWAFDLKTPHQNYRVVRRGVWSPEITISEKETGRIVATTKARISLFGWQARATTQFSDGAYFEWQRTGYFNYKWSWREGDQAIMQAKEKLGLFSLAGDMTILSDNQHRHLLSALGIYLRSATAGKSRLGPITAVVMIILFLIG
ncbi:hypothetical protein ABDK00_000045 [Niabella insulamsoli]|uniref:hypothetical protein n=1 Tax=Niabella insulamsoli TaxID=3144874 RepID=UPI0031FD4AF7